jgi:hypothetical protein
MSERIKIKLGDYFRIPLPDGRWAYCQFVAGTYRGDRMF